MCVLFMSKTLLSAPFITQISFTRTMVKHIVKEGEIDRKTETETRDWERFGSRDRPVTGRTLWWTHYCWQLVCDLMCSPAENSSVESIELGITLFWQTAPYTMEDGCESSILPERSGCISFKGSETVKTYPNHTCGVFLQNWHG